MILFDSIIIVIILLLPFSLLLRSLLFPDHLQHLLNLLMLLIKRLVPIDIVFTRDISDFFSQRIPLFDQALPFLQIEAAGLIELFLTPADGEVERRSIGYFAIVV